MAHTWHFFRAGGVDQVAIRTGADLLALPELDQKLWVALAMPTRDVAIDPATMDLLDGDKDGRVRVPDVLEAVAWVGATWKSADDVLKSSDAVALTAIKDAAVLAAAKRILADAGKASAATIAVADVVDAVKKFSDTTLNGDGIVIPETAGADADTKLAIEEAVAAVGGVTDRSGKPGVDQAKVDAFFADVEAAAAWHKGAEAAATLGADSAAAADALAAVKAKIEDYFARAALAAFDGRAVAGLNGQEADFTALGAKELTRGADDIARLPLTKIEPGKPLALRAGVNPAWADALVTFADVAVKPIVGARDVLTADDFAAVVTKLAPFEAWRSAKPGTGAAKLDQPRVVALATGDARAKIAKLIEDDEALVGDYEAIASVEKLCRFQRDLGRILRNFVNFSDFYSKKDGVFQAGTLYLDGRAFSLTVPVSDAGKHGALAGMSSAYLAYCDLKRAGATRTIAAALTNGDADNVFVGRNGIFYDRDGKDWDATVTKLVANPISVRQAFFAPYKKLVRLIEDQINKRAADADTRSSGKIDAAAAAVAAVDKPKDAAAAPPEKKKLDLGVIAILSLAIAAVAGAVGGLIAMLVKMGVWAPLGVAALLLAISGPSMLLAWMKLRQRNLGPILDANGWAVNVKARVNVAFGASMTALSVLPKGSTRSLEDPYADKKSRWKLWAALVVLLVLGASWYAGKIDTWLPRKIQSVKVIGKNAPGYKGSWREAADLEKKAAAEKAIADKAAADADKATADKAAADKAAADQAAADKAAADKAAADKAAAEAAAPAPAPQ
ncbi:MAG: hypothetical protein IPL61_34090 [Myxococcales bacterium]|nr:hypothetical protein [Myxococcales bacterium]